MVGDADGWKPKRQHRRHTYYKVQTYDVGSLTWRDEKDAFDEVAAARAHIENALAGSTARIMVVEGRNRYPLET
jgi:hypothetical protein